jgi:hypothetical protein
MDQPFHHGLTATVFWENKEAAWASERPNSGRAINRAATGRANATSDLPIHELSARTEVLALAFFQYPNLPRSITTVQEIIGVLGARRATPGTLQERH